MQEKLYIQAVYIDIQGSFDSTTFAVIQEALESRDVGVNMLKCRKIPLTYKDESLEEKVVKGCPQGGVLPTVMYGP